MWRPVHAKTAAASRRPRPFSPKKKTIELQQLPCGPHRPHGSMGRTGSPMGLCLLPLSFLLQYKSLVFSFSLLLFSFSVEWVSLQQFEGHWKRWVSACKSVWWWRWEREMWEPLESRNNDRKMESKAFQIISDVRGTLSKVRANVRAWCVWLRDRVRGVYVRVSKCTTNTVRETITSFF